MPRTARLDIPGQLYHVTARGVDRCDIFVDETDLKSFLERISTLLAETDTVCLAWALMSNHIHLLLRPGPGGLATFMRRLLTGHAVAFNRRHRRSGHLFQNRYHSLLCEEESYLLPLIRYVHLNPLRAGMVPNLEALDSYPWSGHAVLMGNGRLAGQQVDEVLCYFGKSVGAARCKYREFLGEEFEGEQVKETACSGKRDVLHSLGIEKEFCCDDERVLGSQDFAEKVLPAELGVNSDPIGLQVLMRRVAQEFSVNIDDLCSRRRTRGLSDARALICHLGISHMKISGSEMAQHLDLARSSVTRAARRGEELGKEKVGWAERLLRT